MSKILTRLPETNGKPSDYKKVDIKGLEGAEAVSVTIT